MDKEKYRTELADTLFINDKPKLIVIDESHNLRNDKSKRYKFFVDEILKENEDIKVLMLSCSQRWIAKGHFDGSKDRDLC